MKGPIVLLEDTNAAQQLNLTKDQMNQLKDVAKSDDELLTPLRHRFLGLQIQPARQRERTDLESEIESIARVIKEVEKDEDSELLAVLSKEQKNSWSEIRGAPISIDWKMDYFSDTPFVEN
ncbi:MAG TPA: hypothetical protein VHG89_06645 [Verrucomicrobiae bacterium]|nr:hypothetical protein [Verrucomicrobiae bacterium]